MQYSAFNDSKQLSCVWNEATEFKYKYLNKWLEFLSIDNLRGGKCYFQFITCMSAQLKKQYNKFSNSFYSQIQNVCFMWVIYSDNWITSLSLTSCLGWS